MMLESGGQPCLYFTGAGIKDQDRNILVNQQLIVGFLQSCATLLAQGEVPSIHGNPKRRKRPNEDDESEGGKGSSGHDSDHPSDDERTPELTRGNRSIRGSVLITLRDSPPYTLWYAWVLL